MAVLTATAGLTHELHVRLSRTAQRFTVRNLRRTRVRLDFELAHQTIQNDLEVQLTHTGDDRLTRLLVRTNLESRVLFRQRDQTLGKLVAIARRFRLNRNRNHRLGERHRLEHNRLLLEADRITGGHVLQPDRSRDVAGEDLLLLNPLVCVHLEQTPETLTLVRARIVNAHPLRSHSGVNTEVVKFTDKRVGHDLEHQRGERLKIADVTRNRLARGRIGSLDIPDIDGARQIVNHNVEQFLHTFVLESGAAGNRNDLGGKSRTTQRSLDLIMIRHLIGQIDLHDLIIDFRETFDHMLVGGFLTRLEIAGRLLLGHRKTVVLVAEINALVLEHVDHTLELSLAADRQHERNGRRAKLRVDFRHNPVEIRSGTVHLVDQRDNRNMIFLRLTPDRLTLRLHLADRAKHRNGSVKHTERTLHLSREVHVSGSVDDVDPVILPVAGRGRAGDRNAALAFLLHPVHGGRTLMGIANLVVHTAIKKNALGQSGFARVNVGHDADIAVVFQRMLAVRRLMVLAFVLLGTHNHHSRRLPAIMSERLVRLRHFKSVFFLLDRGSGILERIQQLTGERLGHRLALAATRIGRDPPHRQRNLTLRINFDRNLIGRTADTTALHFELRLHILQRLEKHVDRLHLRLLRLDHIERTINNLLSGGFLAAGHDRVDQPGHQLAVVLHVGNQFPLHSTASSHLFRTLSLNSIRDQLLLLTLRGRRFLTRLRTLRAVLGTTLTPLVNAEAVQRTADDVITHTRQIAHTTAFHKHHRVLLQIVPLATDVRRDLLTVGQPDTRNLAQRRVRLLRSTGRNLQTDAPTLRAGAQRLGFTFLRLFFASETHQLVDCRHNKFLFLIFLFEF